MMLSVYAQNTVSMRSCARSPECHVIRLEERPEARYSNVYTYDGQKKPAFHHSNPNCLISRTVNILLSMMDDPPTCTFIVNRHNLHINKISSIFTHPKCLMEY